MPKKDEPNFTPPRQKVSGPQKTQPTAPAPARGHDSRKVHDARGRNTHGRRAT